MKQRILAVDDEKDILKLLEYNLTNAGFELFFADDGPEAIELAKEYRPDLIILDIMLPNMDGNEVLKKLKMDADTRRIPVIMLTAKGEEIDKIVGLELGADDYIVKPFSPRELVLRVKAVLKKDIKPTANLIEAGPVTIDADKFQVFVNEEYIQVTAAEFKLLLMLVQANGRPLGRETLLSRISSKDDYSGTRTIDTHIRRLRNKLGVNEKLIETVTGLGYRFRKGL